MTEVSVIVPVFNRKDLLEETIRSVMAQKYPHWELLLVDDGSTDGSKEICRKFAEQDDRIKFFQREGTTKGASVCRNIGIKNAKGNYLIFLDSDDLLAPWCIEQRLQYVNRYPGLDFYVFPMILFKEQVDDMMVLQNIPTTEDTLLRFLHRENVWLMSCPLWTKSAITKLNGFNEKYLSYQDWELNVKALAQGLKYDFFITATPDNFYRQHDQTISASRFTQPHNISNAEMLLDITVLLKKKNLLDEHKRCILAGFFVDIIKRAKLLSLPVKEIREFTGTYTAKAVSAGMIIPTEKTEIDRYIYWHTVKIAFRSKWFRERIEKHFRKKRFPQFFPAHITNQLKHKYTGNLA